MEASLKKGSIAGICNYILLRAEPLTGLKRIYLPGLHSLFYGFSRTFSQMMTLMFVEELRRMFQRAKRLG